MANASTATKTTAKTKKKLSLQAKLLIGLGTLVTLTVAGLAVIVMLGSRIR